MAPTRVQAPQIPDLSPTYLHSTSPSEPPAPPVRRNLFSAHLSRRPASDQASRSPSNARSQADQHTQPETNPFAPHPQLRPTSTQLAMNDIYDPSISPNRPISPESSATLFPGSSIIALHPGTSRPILPNLPSLPGKLTLNDDEGDPNHDHDPNHSYNHLAFAGHDTEFSDPDLHHTHSSLYAGSMSDPYSSSIQEAPYPPSTAAAAALLDETDAEQRDRERIERLLAEMMARQRARAKGKEAGDVTAGRTRRTAVGRHEEDDDEEDDVAEGERQELMGLIMASLRRNVAVAEDEGWMYGDAKTGVGVGSFDGTGYE